jgi:hypothetical protein
VNDYRKWMEPGMGIFGTVFSMGRKFFVVLCPILLVCWATDYSVGAGPFAASVKLSIFEMINKERVKAGLKPFKVSEALDRVSFLHAEQMCEKRITAHNSPEFRDKLRTFRVRLKATDLKEGAENGGSVTKEEKTAVTAKYLVEGWMNSPGHRTNILNPKYNYIGIGAVDCSDKIIYVAQMFAPDPGTAPPRNLRWDTAERMSMFVIRLLLLVVMFIALAGCAPAPVRKPTPEPPVREQPKFLEEDIIEEPGARVESRRPEDQQPSKLPEPGAGDAAVESPLADQQQNPTVKPSKQERRHILFKRRSPGGGKRWQENTGDEEREP